MTAAPRVMRPYLSKKVAAGLRPAAKALEAAMQARLDELVSDEDREAVSVVVQWLRDNANWYESGDR